MSKYIDANWLMAEIKQIIDLPLNDDWINNLQAIVSGTIFDDPELLEGGTEE